MVFEAKHIILFSSNSHPRPTYDNRKFKELLKFSQVRIFSFYHPRLLSLENAKGKNWNCTKKSGEKNMTCKRQPISAQAEEEQRAAGEPSTQEAQGREPIEKDLWKMVELPVHKRWH